jgi:hypothetical protein
LNWIGISHNLSNYAPKKKKKEKEKEEEEKKKTLRW